MSFDVDYYSSTVDLLRIFDAHEEFLLPRVYCYLDDIIGDDWEIHCEYVGELLAIKEFKLHGMNKCLLCMPLITPCIANTSTQSQNRTSISLV